MTTWQHKVIVTFISSCLFDADLALLTLCAFPQGPECYS